MKFAMVSLFPNMTAVKDELFDSHHCHAGVHTKLEDLSPVSSSPSTSTNTGVVRVAMLSTLFTGAG